MKPQTFNHISQCWEYLEQFSTVEELKHHLGDLPSRFGKFEINSEQTVEEDVYIQICNTYYNRQIDDCDYDYHTIKLKKNEE